MSGGQGSLVPWDTLGREGRRHVLAHVHPQPVADRPEGVPDLSIQTVMGEPAKAAPAKAGPATKAKRPRSALRPASTNSSITCACRFRTIAAST